MLHISLRNIVLISILLLIRSYCISQDNYDYLITVDEDTLRGEITLGVNYSKKVIIQVIDSNEKLTFKASEVKEFSDDGHIYHSLKLDASPFAEMRELLVDGTVKLYERENSKDLKAFIISKDNQYTLLEQTTYIDNSKYVNNPIYLRYLKNALANQPEIVKRIDRTRFNKYELGNLINDYNINAGGASSDFSKQRRKIRLTTLLELSLATEGLVTNSKGIVVRTGIDDLNLGIGFLVGLKNHQGQEVNIGIEVSQYASTFSNEFTLGTQTWKFNNYILSIPARMNFKFGDGNLKPVLMGELTYSTMLTKSFNYSITGPSGDTLLNEDRRLSLIKSTGFRFGGGVLIHSHLQILIKYSSFRYGFIENREISSLNLNPFSLSIGYVF